MKKLLIVFIVLYFTGANAYANESETNNSGDATAPTIQPREIYEWNTNPNGSSTNSIWINPKGYAKLKGPYWGGYKVDTQRHYKISWSGSGANTSPRFVMKDGTTGNILANVIGNPGKTGIVYLTAPLGTKSVNLFVYNDSNVKIGFWNFYIQSFR